MANQRIANSLAAAAIMGFFAIHAATAQQTPSLPLPAGSTANFVHFATGSYALTPEEQDHIRDVAGMILSTPGVVITIIGKTDTVGSAEFNEHLSQRRAEAVFEALVYAYKVPAYRVRLHWTGERLPYISTADEQAEAQNRMVAIIVGNDPADEADAKRLLKAMSDYLGAQKAMSFDYDVYLELVSTQQQKIGLASSGTVTLDRPDKLHLTRTGGFANVAMVFDGNTLTLLGKNTNLYTQLEAPGYDRSIGRRIAEQVPPARPRSRYADIGSLQCADAGGHRCEGSGSRGDPWRRMRSPCLQDKGGRLADLDRARSPPLPVSLCHHEQEGYRVAAIHPRYLGMENGRRSRFRRFQIGDSPRCQEIDAGRSPRAQRYTRSFHCC